MRLATPHDLPTLRTLAHDALVHDPDAPAIVDLLWDSAGTGCRIAAVGADGAVTGFVLASLRPARAGRPAAGHRPASADQPATGHLDLLVVAAEHRGRGLGRALLAEAEQRLIAAGATRLRIRGNPPHHAWPGIDIRYTPAACLAAAAGYERLPDGDNMLVDLAAAHREGLLATGADERRLAALGIEVRRGTAEDEEELRAWVETEFGGSWAEECSMALRPRKTGLTGETAQAGLPGGTGETGETEETAHVDRTGETGRAELTGEIVQPGLPGQTGETEQAGRAGQAARAGETGLPTLHVAVRDGAFLGFAAHGAQRVPVFGPMGTGEAARGLGIGAVLLRRCLADQRDAGVAVAEIGWVGPVRFYSRTVGASLGRVFWTFEKAVAA